MRAAALAMALSLAAPKHAPLPAELLAAKTVYIVNDTGYQQVMDEAYVRIGRWRRFAVAPDRSKADLVLTFDVVRTAASSRNGNSAGTRTLVIMTVTAPGEAQPVFEDTCASGLFSKAANTCIDDLHERLERP